MPVLWRVRSRLTEGLEENSSTTAHPPAYPDSSINISIYQIDIIQIPHSLSGQRVPVPRGSYPVPPLSARTIPAVKVPSIPMLPVQKGLKNNSGGVYGCFLLPLIQPVFHAHTDGQFRANDSASCGLLPDPGQAATS